MENENFYKIDRLVVEELPDGIKVVFKDKECTLTNNDIDNLSIDQSYDVLPGLHTYRIIDAVDFLRNRQ